MKNDIKNQPEVNRADLCYQILFLWPAWQTSAASGQTTTSTGQSSTPSR